MIKEVMSIHLPVDLSNDQLITELNRFASSEKQATAQLVAHLAELDARGLYAALGFSSLFTYACDVLHLSEHEAYNRIEAARLARKFPVVLDLLGDGQVNLTTLRLLAPHLTPDNHGELLAAATHKRKREVEELVARVAPKPDVASSVRKLPVRHEPPLLLPALAAVPNAAPPLVLGPPAAAPRRSVVTPLAPDRYQITITVGGETRDKLRRLQDLLRHSIPNGDPAQIVDRALTLLLKEEMRRKCSATSKPRKAKGVAPHSRHIPAEVNRAAYARDGGSCSFVGKNGRRCGERAFIQRDHVKPYGAMGEAIVGNIRLLCFRHNQYEADQFYGARREEHMPSSFQNELRASRRGAFCATASEGSS
jgi:hypothetical protein